MPEFRYARGRISESLAFIAREMGEFDSEYARKTWQEYASDTKTQKLVDRTLENILTAVIEVSGTVLTENDIAAESYVDILSKIGDYFGFSKEDSDHLAKFAIHRNRLAHRYLDLKWQVVQYYGRHHAVIQKLASAILEYERKKDGERRRGGS